MKGVSFRCVPTLRVVIAAGAAALVSACSAYRAVNAPLAHYDTNSGYRPKNELRERPMGEVLPLLAFSGGGTRVAALSYGVLQELRDTEVTVACRFFSNSGEAKAAVLSRSTGGRG